MRAANASSKRTARGTWRRGGSTSRTAQMVASANMLVAWPLGKPCSITCPTDGLSTYSVRPTAAGTATAAKTAPDHLRVATQATTSTRVISATGLSVPRSGSHESSTGKRLRPVWIRGSSTESSRPGCPWPADCAARATVTAAHAASSVAVGTRSHLGSNSCGTGPRRERLSDVPLCISPLYACIAIVDKRPRAQPVRRHIGRRLTRHRTVRFASRAPCTASSGIERSKVTSRPS